jgi:NADH dehydrogenase
MLARIAAAAGRRKLVLPMPIGIMRLAATLLDRLPFFPVTRDQLTMLAEGNTADPAALRSLIGREPRAFVADNLRYLAQSAETD